MKKCYIHSAVSISAQHTFDAAPFLTEVALLSEKTACARHPEYKGLIAPSALRRMATGVKMGVAVAKKALKEAHIELPEAIITGTGMGCMEDTEKFLNTILSNQEAYIAPSSFIESTHNTVGAKIALGLRCNAYNNTYVHASVSFESALLDTHLMITQGEANNVLVGGVDELGTELIGYTRMMEEASEGGISVPFGEGASFFVASQEPSLHPVELLDIAIYHQIPREGVVQALSMFLESNGLAITDIDIVITGNNGDRFDAFYEAFENAFPSETVRLNYKHLCGEYHTASAFGFWIACKILKHQTVPEILMYGGIIKKKYGTILLYNQYKGKGHSFTMLSRC